MTVGKALRPTSSVCMTTIVIRSALLTDTGLTRYCRIYSKENVPEAVCCSSEANRRAISRLYSLNLGEYLTPKIRTGRGVIPGSRASKLSQRNTPRCCKRCTCPIFWLDFATRNLQIRIRKQMVYCTPTAVLKSLSRQFVRPLAPGEVDRRLKLNGASESCKRSERSI